MEFQPVGEPLPATARDERALHWGTDPRTGKGTDPRNGPSGRQPRSYFLTWACTVRSPSSPVTPQLALHDGRDQLRSAPYGLSEHGGLRELPMRSATPFVRCPYPSSRAVVPFSWFSPRVLMTRFPS